MKRESETFLSKEEREKYIVHIPLSKERKVSLPTNDTWQDWKHGRLQKPSHTEAYHIGSIRIEDIGGEEEAWIRKKIALRDDSEVSPEEIDAFPYSHR